MCHVMKTPFCVFMMDMLMRLSTGDEQENFFPR